MCDVLKVKKDRKKKENAPRIEEKGGEGAEWKRKKEKRKEGENRDSLWGRRAGFSAYAGTLNLPFLLSDRLVRGKSRHGNREWTFQSRGGFLASNLLPISPGIRRAFEFRRVNSKAPSPSPSLPLRRPLDFDAFVEFIERIENLVRATSHMRPLLSLSLSLPVCPFSSYTYVKYITWSSRVLCELDIWLICVDSTRKLLGYTNELSNSECRGGVVQLYNCRINEIEECFGTCNYLERQQRLSGHVENLRRGKFIRRKSIKVHRERVKWKIMKSIKFKSKVVRW